MSKPPPHTPARGSDVEAWIKETRDRFRQIGQDASAARVALDDLLDDYRLRADVGAALDTPRDELGPPNA